MSWCTCGRRAPRLAATAAVALAAALSSASGVAQAAPGSRLLLTLAARVCPKYEDIMANRARNNIMESLRDLGPNTVYTEGQPVNPAVEETVQPNCKALPHWEFSLGSDYITRAVSGYWGSLSIITGATREPVETKESEPLLDSRGSPTGSSIHGAVTIELNAREAELAKKGSLWVQGGTPSDPILSKRYPEQYAFGSLRCAIDNLNGDNVEWVGFPTGYTHMFCFAYYVQPPPTAGTIIIRKKIVGHGSGVPETFSFTGNVSFNPGGKFDLTVAPPSTEARTTFIRGETKTGEAPWHVREEVPKDWNVSGLSCHSEKGTSETAIKPKHEATIVLAPEDTVECVYEDRFVPPAGELTVRKVSIGDTGTFGFSIKHDRRPFKEVAKVFATTLQEAFPVDALPAPVKVRPGNYTIDETSATPGRGTWVVTDDGCDNSRGHGVHRTIYVKVESGESVSCTFRNEVRPTASLRIQKKTEKGTGSFGFAVVSRDRPAEAIIQTADVTREGEPFDAHGGSTDALYFEPYLIQELPPPPTEAGHWVLVAVSCDGQDVPFQAGAAIVDITEDASSPVCVFTDRFEAKEEPPPPIEESARISLRKVTSTPDIKLGGKAHFTITVTGEGPAPAREVVVDDQAESSATFVSADPSQGTCNKSLPLHCELGELAKGAKATIHVVVIPHKAGRFTNHAVAGLGNPDPDFSKDTARAHVLVRARRKRIPAHKPSFTG
ncbi:MAG TPA: DUF11 domain-containing protein [Solirubrobacteraceae bacterium]|nr:DUF11 domain-containing protein [Solirubrobacteraceae bacterium]